MDRAQWRRERRLWNEVQMDTLHARHYDEQNGQRNSLRCPFCSFPSIQSV